MKKPILIVLIILTIVSVANAQSFKLYYANNVGDKTETDALLHKDERS